jgi:hypothetical protein
MERLELGTLGGSRRDLNLSLDRQVSLTELTITFHGEDCLEGKSFTMRGELLLDGFDIEPDTIRQIAPSEKKMRKHEQRQIAALIQGSMPEDFKIYF